MKQKNSCLFEFPACLLPTNLGQPMHSPSALTEHVSLNLARLFLLYPVRAARILDALIRYVAFGPTEVWWVGRSRRPGVPSRLSIASAAFSNYPPHCIYAPCERGLIFLCTSTGVALYNVDTCHLEEDENTAFATLPTCSMTVLLVFSTD